MPDYKVRFVGDLGNLAQFERAIKNSLGESARQLDAANAKVASRAGNISADTFDPKTSGPGLYRTNTQTIVDGYNRTFKQVGDIVHRSLVGYKAEFDKTEGQFVVKAQYKDEFTGQFKETIGDLDVYQRALQQTAKTEVQILGLQKARAEESAKIQQQVLENEKSIQGLKGAATSVLSTVEPGDIFGTNANFGLRNYDNIVTQLENLKALKVSLQSGTSVRVAPISVNGKPDLFGGKSFVPRDDILNLISQKQQAKIPTTTTQFISPSTIKELDAEIAALKNSLALGANYIQHGTVEIDAALSDYDAIVQQKTGAIQADIAHLVDANKQLKLVEEQGIANTQIAANKLRNRNPAFEAAGAAGTSAPPIDKDLQRALQTSKTLRNELITNGLGGGARFSTDTGSEFVKNLGKQEAAVTKFTRNFRTGVTTIEGSLKSLDKETGQLGGVEKFTADVDKQGKVITRWGGQLGGASGALRQTVRDFQKVIEWTVATTAVFGTLGLAIKGLGTINELNTALTRFSITSQTSLGDARDIFKDLGQVAIDTATPLIDLVKVADDIALATKKAGDSSDEWKQKIIDLTTAVGIFTNLTGESTVEAADKLGSAFKQLGIAPSGLLEVLNKVTAVAGGQSTAINDIITALGGVAEAGKAAGLTLNQQIGLVQTLGQVTNKSAADTATAFKNLFGSLGSKGSEKILKEFGISIRDAAGGLRPFLDVYRDINKALEAGIIPANRYQDVLRGISGGPRRAPDAAALLGNLPAVEAAIARASGASNEALIANAKILDTNAAKIQQLQNAFDIAIFEKFGKAVQDATASVTGLLTALLQVFNKVDPKLITLLLQLAAFAAAGKGLALVFTKTGGALRTSFEGIGKSIRNAAADFVTFGQKAYIAEEIAAGTLVASGPKGIQKNPKTGRFEPIPPTPSDRFRDPKTGRFAKIGGGEAIAGALSATGLKTGIGNIKEYVKNLGALRTTLLLVGATAALTVAQQAAAGGWKGIDPQTIGSVLQLAGSVSLATGVFAPLGVAALATGTALQLFGQQADDVKISAHDAAVSVYDAIQALKDARAQVVTAEKAQESAKATLDAIVASGKKDAETKAAQVDATQNFVTATIDLANANKLASDSYDTLLAKIPELGEKYAVFKDIVNRGNRASQEDIDALSNQIAAEILKINGQTLNPGPINTSKYREAPLTLPVPTYAGSDFKPDSLKPENLNKLFDLNNGGKPLVYIPPSDQNAATLQASLQDVLAGKVAGLTPDQVDVLVKAITDWTTTISSYGEIQSKLATDAAKVQALIGIGALKGDKAVNAQNRVSAAGALFENINNAGTTVNADKESRFGGATGGGVSKLDVAKLIEQIRSGEVTGKSLNADELTKIGTVLLTLNGSLETLKATGNDALRDGIAKSLIDIGFDAIDVNKILGILPGTIQQSAEEMQAMIELTKSFDDAAASAQTKYAERNAALQQASNGGEYDKNAKGLAILKNQSEAAYQSELKLIASFKALATGSVEDQAALDQLKVSLSGVYGFENATTIASDQLAAKFIDNAIAAGVNAEGIRKLQEDVRKLILLNQILGKLRPFIKITVDVDAATALKKLKALYAAIKATEGNSPDARDQLSKMAAAIAELEAYLKLNPGNKSSKDYTNDINTIIKGGKGSQLGGLPKSGSGSSSGSKTSPGLDVSNLDLPDEIANASNRSALIQEAIKRAKALQAKIPGANKDAKNDVVELLKGTQRILEVRGVKDDLLRKALEELAAIEKKKLEFETKADTIRRIRVGAGDFAALANVPLNTKTGVSVGGPDGPISINLNINGQLLTPAQFAALADQIASAIKRQLGGP